jgi:hypothetical protein
MRKISILIFLSIILALVINTFSTDYSFDEQLIHIQIKKELSKTINNIDQESIEIQSIFLDYSEDKELLLKTQLALMKYPEQTRRVLLLFGSKNDFKEIIKNYGENVIPVINYFLTTDIKQTIKLIDKAGKLASQIKSRWNGETESIEAIQELTKEKQARYIVQIIKDEGYDFLGQFAINDQGEVKWIQTERISEGLTSFFTSGIRNVETKYKLEQEITAADLIWASVDVLAAAGTLKVLRASKQAARAGKSVRITRQTKLFGARLLKTGFAGRLIKVSAIAATGWIMIKHPSLITSLFGDLGKLIGLPPLLAQVIGVALLAFILFYPVLWILRWIARPVIMLTKLILNGLVFLEKRLQGTVRRKVKR